jgi:hypothetical protein
MEPSQAGKENEQGGEASSSGWMNGWMDAVDNSTQWDGFNRLKKAIENCSFQEWWVSPHLWRLATVFKEFLEIMSPV